MATKRLSTGFQPIVGDLVRDHRYGGGEFIVIDDQNIKDFSIHDVVLPLPGHGVIYPANAEYAALQIADDLSLISIKDCTK